MAEVQPRDILLRIGPKTLERYQSLAVAGAGRGRAVPLPYTFTRAAPSASDIDRDGTLRLAGVDKLRIEWVDLDGDGIRETPGVLLEGSRINLIENGDYEADAVGSNPAVATIVRDATNVRLGSWALKVTTTNAGASGVFWTKRDATKMLATAGTAYSKGVWVYAPAASVGKTVVLRLEWYTAADAFISTFTSSPFTLVAGWQRLVFRNQVAPGTTGKVAPTLYTDAAEGVFDFWVDLVQFEAGAFESSAIPTGTGAITRAADSLTVPFNFGPMDLTVLARVARPAWADVSGDLGTFSGIADIGNEVSQHWRLYHSSTARELVGQVNNSPGAGPSVNAAIPAGAELRYAAQFKKGSATVGPQVAIDVGSGFGAFSGNATVITAFGSQTLRIGAVNQGGLPLYGVLLDLIIAGGLFTKAEMEAVP